MKKITLHTTVSLALLLMLLVACNQPTSQPQREIFNQCDMIRKNIEQAQSIASEIEHFNWNEFSAIGILYPPQGVCPVGNLPIVERDSVDIKLLDRVIPLLEGLPSPKTAETYYLQCDNCLKLATKVCSQSPYNQYEGAAGSENITAQRQQLYSQLQSALQGAQYLASRDKTIAEDYTFPKLLAYFSASDEKVKGKYLEMFIAKSDEYIKLFNEFIHNVQEAKQTTTELYDRQFGIQDTSPQ